MNGVDRASRLTLTLTRAASCAAVLLVASCASVGGPVRKFAPVVDETPTTSPAEVVRGGLAEDQLPSPKGAAAPGRPEVILPRLPVLTPEGKPLPITLPAALSLADAAPLDVALAEERVNVASAQLDRAALLWLPNVNVGVDYFRHDGQIQDIVGTVFTTSRSSLLLGAGPQATLSLTDAVHAPLVARQVALATKADARAARNDATLNVATAYFNVQQARGELAGSLESLRRAEDLARRAEKLVPDLAPGVEVNRARAEAARRRQGVEAAYERWQVASAELTRLLRLQPGTLVEPAEAPSLAVDVVDPARGVEELIPLALTHRPELASYQATVQATLERVRQEKARPYLPTVAVRGVGSNTPNLAGGYFGGGINSSMKNFGSRFSIDLQAVWEFQNLGLGNRALVREREAENRRALLELLRSQEAITAEVVQAHAQVARARSRMGAAKDQVAEATASADKNLQGLGETKRLGEQLVLIFRPQEVLAAVIALDQAYRDYYQAVGDYNRAQFRLYRALGHPGGEAGVHREP